MNNSNSGDSDDLEIRLMKELHEIKLQLSEMKALFGNSEMRFKMAINEHQVNCPMMHKKPIIEGQSYDEWKRCHAMHTKETGKSFDVWYDRGKKIIIVMGGIYILVSNLPWLKIIETIK